MISTAAVTFAAIWIGLYVAHQVMDHWGQTSKMAGCKGLAGWKGRRACAAHVAAYTVGTAVITVALVALLDLDVSIGGLILGQAVSAITHYWADRRTTLAKLAALTGKGEFYRLGAPRSVELRQVDPATGEPGDQLAEVVLVDSSTGKAVLIDNPSLGTGAYALDQSYHYCWLFVAALISALV